MAASYGTRMICEECQSEDGYYRNILKKLLCQSCIKLDKYTLVSKTNVKKDFFIKSELLVECRHYVGYHNHQPTTLYTLSDVLSHFCAIYNIPHDKHHICIKRQQLMDEFKVAREKRRELRLASKNRAAIKRQTDLIEALNKYQLEYDEKNRLCRSFVEGEVGFGVGVNITTTMDDIVHRMCQMKFLYDYCHMEYFLNKIQKKDEQSYEISIFRKYFGYKYGNAIYYILEKAEKMALDAYGCPSGSYPPHWGWLT